MFVYSVNKNQATFYQVCGLLATVLLEEQSNPIVCTQEIVVSASEIPRDQTLARLNALLKKDTSEYDYKDRCNIEDVATEIQEMKFNCMF